MIREAFFIGTGATAGALARFALLLVFGDGLWPILIINLLGALLLGALRPGAFLGAGVLGGFTTFSTFTALTLAQSTATAAAYLTGTILGCVAAWLTGDRLYRARSRSRKNLST